MIFKNRIQYFRLIDLLGTRLKIWNSFSVQTLTEAKKPTSDFLFHVCVFFSCHFWVIQPIGIIIFYRAPPFCVPSVFFNNFQAKKIYIVSLWNHWLSVLYEPHKTCIPTEQIFLLFANFTTSFGFCSLHCIRFPFYVRLGNCRISSSYNQLL